jgi:hypothetical protein
MDVLPQANPPRRARRVDAVARVGWLMPTVVAAGVGGLMVWAAGAVRVPGPRAGSEVGAEPLPALRVTRLDALPLGGEARERLRLLDPTPLIMPGGRFGGVQFTPEGPEDRPGGAAGAPIPPALAFSAQRPTREILRPQPPADAAAAAEMLAAGRWFGGMARMDAPSRAGVADPVVIAGSGRVDVFPAGESRPIVSAELPPDELLAAETWRPVELSMVVSVAGPVTPPVVRTGSGSEEADQRVRMLLAREVLPRLALRPGSYRLVVGP